MSKKKKSQKRRVTRSKSKAENRKRRTSFSIYMIASFTFLLILILIVYFNYPSFKKFPIIRSFINDQQASKSLKIDTPFPAAKPTPSQSSIRFEDFAGSEACAPCHTQEYQLWKNSTHGLAGGEPGKVKIISPFNGKPLRYKDATVTPSITPDGDYIFSVKREGKPKSVFKVDAVVGGGHMLGGGTQALFTRSPDGTLRFLPFDYIKKEGVWFSQKRSDKHWIPVDENLSLAELNEWPPRRILGTEESFPNCQNCHGSQIRVRYDQQKKHFQTQYKSLSINCESCHGPGKKHIALMQSDSAEARQDIGLRSLAPLSKDESLLVCFQCHAIKDMIGKNYLSGMPLENYFALKLPILADNPYLPDGRIRKFGYQLNHLSSDCYLNGSMTCVDCHAPHSLKYRDIYNNPLQGKFDNGQCLDCHPSKSVAPEEHSHHKPGSQGNLCTSCHMPYLQHQLLGNKLRFARSDHTIPIPRPEYDAKHGIENACIKCHRDKSNPWLQAKVDEWYGQIKPHKKIVISLDKADDILDRKEAAASLLDSTANHPMAQVAALSKFIKNYLQPDMATLEPEIISRLKALSMNNDLDVKSLALMALHLARGNNPEMQKYLRRRLNQLGKEEMPVRWRWATSIDFLGTVYNGQGNYTQAILAHKKALQLRPDDVVALVNLGSSYGNRGDLTLAIAAFQKAIALDPGNIAALTNLGKAYTRQNEFNRAIQAYNQAMEMKPYDPTAYILLAQTYLQLQQPVMASETLRLGHEYMPDNETIQLLQQGLKAMENKD